MVIENLLSRVFCLSVDSHLRVIVLLAFFKNKKVQVNSLNAEGASGALKAMRRSFN